MRYDNEVIAQTSAYLNVIEGVYVGRYTGSSPLPNSDGGIVHEFRIEEVVSGGFENSDDPKNRGLSSLDMTVSYRYYPPRDGDDESKSAIKRRAYRGFLDKLGVEFDETGYSDDNCIGQLYQFEYKGREYNGNVYYDIKKLQKK